ncbi:MAG: hypothetical protein HY885_10260 [Deltaproteobacteria bacterium]|nr:hypothetical protein [Deltaproteobacteria bacterium]
MNHSTLLAILILGQFVAGQAMAGMSIVDSKHNLSITGPGEIRALTEDRICIFCHTPHNAAPGTPLWNKNLQPTNYTLYQSSTLSATPRQPSGPTRLCLSCHDGTIALGDVLRPVEGIQMSMELTARTSNLDTDISNDHPVSFNYYEALPNPELAPAIPQGLRSYGDGNIHCTTCHDPHDDTFGKFLVMGNEYSALCTTCHVNVAGWSTSSHATSTKTWNGGSQGNTKTVAEHACASCHRPHGAGGPKRLLHQLEEEKNCYPCHDGTVASLDIKAQFSKISHHPVAATTIDVTGNAHDPAEDLMFLQDHVECVDCHNPHAAYSDQSIVPNASGSLALVAGKAQSGAVVAPLVYEYELCFKCHGDSSNSIPLITRWSNENNTMLEFTTTNPSYHPVIAIGRNPDVPTLPSVYEPEMTATSMIACTSCHDSNESPAIGGAGPNGPHGSIYRPILRQRYDTMDNLPESEASYALCYRCHDRTKLLDDQGLYNASGHRRHVADQRTPCSACHDPHGVKNDGLGDHTHLINFDVAIVSPFPPNATPLFFDLGTRSGRCLLVCHGKSHDGGASSTYP